MRSNDDHDDSVRTGGSIEESLQEDASLGSEVDAEQHGSAEDSHDDDVRSDDRSLTSEDSEGDQPQGEDDDADQGGADQDASGEDTGDQDGDVDWKALAEQYEKRWRDTRSSWDRDKNQLNELRHKIGDIPIDEAVQEYQRRAQAVPVYDSRHPEHQQWKHKHEMFGVFRRQLQAHPDKREEVAEVWGDYFNDDDLASFRQYESFLAEENARLADPAYRQQIFEREVREHVQRELGQAQAFQQRESQVREILSDKDNWDTINPRLDEWIARAQRGQSAEDILNDFRRDAELKRLRELQADADRKAAGAREQKRAARGRATQGRDIEPTDTPDIYREALQIAKDNGIQEGSAQFNQLLAQLEQRYT